MNILHLSMLYPPHALGGAERSVAMLAEAQAAAGHTVNVVCTTPGAFTKEERNGVRVFRMPHGTRFWAEDWPKHSGVERLWRKAALPFNRVQRRHFAAILDRVRPDVVHTHSMVDVATGIWADTARKGYPVVHTLRDYDLLCADGAMYHGGKGCGAKCRLVSAAKQHHAHAIDAVTAVGRQTLGIHLDRGLFADVPEELRQVIWNSAPVAGIGPDYRRPDRADQPFTFGYIGRINEEKGVGLLIEAARHLPVDGSWRMVIAGEGVPSLDPFLAAATGLPIDFPGFMEPRQFFEGIDVLVVPSIWAEPFGRIVIEAYGAGVPVLGSNAGGIPDLVVGAPDQWLFPAGDREALTERLERLLEGGRSALPDGALFATRIGETAPAVIASRYHDLYDAVARRRKGHA